MHYLLLEYLEWVYLALVCNSVSSFALFILSCILILRGMDSIALLHVELQSVELIAE